MVANARMQCGTEGGSLPVPYPEPSYQAVLRKYNAECSGYKIAFGIFARRMTNKRFRTDNGERANLLMQVY
jgi:hypothetical protein